jgi:hypothetical protein
VDEFKEDILKALYDIRTELVEVKADLREHMRRTEILEERSDAFMARLDPMEKHVERWAGAGKAVAILGSAVGLLAGLWKLFEAAVK